MMRNVLALMPALAFVVLCALTFLQVSHYAVDIPFWDEWEVLKQPGRLSTFDLGWLFEQHNEHRIVLTKFMTTLQFQLDGWNLRHQVLFNYVFYALAVAWLGYFCHRAAPELDGRAWPAFLIFLFAPSLAENLLWGFQSQFHFAWFFAFLSIFLVFSADVTPRRMVAAVAAALAAMYSFSGGMVMTTVLTLSHGAYRLVRAWLLPTQRWRETRTALAFTIPVALGLALWFTGYVRPEIPWELTPPHKGRFWLYLGDVVIWGFGVESSWPRIGWLVMLAMLYPLFSSLRQDRWTSPYVWMVGTAVVAVWGFLGTIAMGRAALFAPAGAKISRYAEIAGLLLPLTAAAWAIYFRDQPGRRVAVLALVWFLAFLAYRDDWAYERFFEHYRGLRAEAKACVDRYYSGEGDGKCPTAYPVAIAEPLTLAKELGVSFTRPPSP